MSDENDMKPVVVNASDIIFNLSDTALEHGIGSVKTSGGPLIPFVITLVDGEKSLTRYVTNNIADGVKTAIDSINTLPKTTQAYAVAYDTILHLGENKVDAIVVEVGERGGQFDHKFAQRYKPKKLFSKFELLGNPMYLGQYPARLK